MESKVVTWILILGVVGGAHGIPNPENDEGGQKYKKGGGNQPPAYSTPKCYKRYQLSGLSIWAFRSKKVETPEECAKTCQQINNDDDSPRECLAFDFNLRTGLCRFYSRTSRDDNVRIIDNPKTDLYESDGSCRSAQRNGQSQSKSSTPRSGGSGPQKVPQCFIKHQSSALSAWSFRPKKYDTPQACANVCVKVFKDEDDPRTCRAFDFNSKTSVCRLYDKNTQDDNVKLTDNPRTDIYEFDEACWTRSKGPPTLPPHVNACPSGSKPLMEKVNGWHLNTAGLTFKGVQETTCYDSCLKDKLPLRDKDYKCLSVSYNNETHSCLYLNAIASPLNRRGAPLQQDSRYTYYAKMCLPEDTISKCPGYVTRFTGRELVAMTDAKLTTYGYPECVKACLTAETKLEFKCLSGMFYNNATSENCVLNYADHYQEPTLFIFDPSHVVDYFSVKSCHTQVTVGQTNG